MNLNHDIATNVNEIKNLQDLILEYYTTGEISTLLTRAAAHILH